MDNIIEIRDPKIDIERIYQQGQTNIRQRQQDEAHQSVLTQALTTAPAAVANVPSSVSTGMADLNRALIELSASTGLQEAQFTSNLPLLGPLIVRLRQAWNWMSTKWYVRPIIWQQSQINARMATIMSEMELWQQLHVAQVAQLQQRVAYLEDVVAQQQAQLQQEAGDE